MKKTSRLLAVLGALAVTLSGPVFAKDKAKPKPMVKALNEYLAQHPIAQTRGPRGKCGKAVSSVGYRKNKYSTHLVLRRDEQSCSPYVVVINTVMLNWVEFERDPNGPGYLVHAWCNGYRDGKTYSAKCADGHGYSGGTIVVDSKEAARKTADELMQLLAALEVRQVSLAPGAGTALDDVNGLGKFRLARKRTAIDPYRWNEYERKGGLTYYESSEAPDHYAGVNLKWSRFGFDESEMLRHVRIRTENVETEKPCASLNETVTIDAHLDWYGDAKVVARSNVNGSDPLSQACLRETFGHGCNVRVYESPTTQLTHKLVENEGVGPTNRVCYSIFEIRPR